MASGRAARSEPGGAVTRVGGEDSGVDGGVGPGPPDERGEAAEEGVGAHADVGGAGAIFFGARWRGRHRNGRWTTRPWMWRSCSGSTTGSVGRCCCDGGGANWAMVTIRVEPYDAEHRRLLLDGPYAERIQALLDRDLKAYARDVRLPAMALMLVAGCGSAESVPARALSRSGEVVCTGTYPAAVVRQGQQKHTLRKFAAASELRSTADGRTLS